MSEEMSANNEAKWYVVHTYSGYENKVKTILEKTIARRNMQDVIQEISVPTEDVVEIKDGKKKVVPRKRYPGYVFIKFVSNFENLKDSDEPSAADKELWYLIRNTRGVTGFVSTNPNKPLHLGHIRNNLLGDSVSRLLKASGNNVIKTTLVNDRGVHICKSMLAWLKVGNGATPESSGKKGDHLVGDMYVAFNDIFTKEVEELVAG